MWDSQPPHSLHCDSCNMTFMNSTRYNLDYEGPTKEGYVGASIAGQSVGPDTARDGYNWLQQ